MTSWSEPLVTWLVGLAFSQVVSMSGSQAHKFVPHWLGMRQYLLCHSSRKTAREWSNVYLQSLTTRCVNLLRKALHGNKMQSLKYSHGSKSIKISIYAHKVIPAYIEIGNIHPNCEKDIKLLGIITIDYKLKFDEQVDIKSSMTIKCPA